MEEVKKERKKQPYVSYLKGFAIIAVMMIHLIDWGALSGIKFFSLFKELLFPGVMFFVSMVGALVYFAYKDSDIKKSSFKLVKRGLQVIGVYYLYNIIKLFVFNFSKQPYFGSFNGSDRAHDLINILSLKSADVPLSILFTLGVFMIISPLFLFVIKKAKYPKLIILLILCAAIIVNYFIVLPHNLITNVLYSNGYVFFPIMFWIIPYLSGILLSMIGFEQKKKIIFPFFAFLTLLIGCFYYFSKTSSFLPSYHMYPLDLYYVVYSTFFMYLLFYLFGFLEKIQKDWSNKFLNVTKFLGENTLSIFIFHWVIIDLTYWLFTPKEWMILITVPVFVVPFILIKYKLAKKTII